VVDLLVLVEPLVEVALAAGRRPEHVPLMRLRVAESVELEKLTEKLVVKT
jgi:hypothetical protein